MPSLPGYTIPQRYKALAPYVVGDSVRDNGDIDAHCPLHDDAKRSAVINFEDGVWWCARCDGGSIEELLSRRGDWLPPPSGAPRTRTVRRQATTPDGLPSEDKILEWQQALMSDSVLIDDLKATRGVWTKTLEVYEIGWDANESVYTLPVRDFDGNLINVRRYQLRPPKRTAEDLGSHRPQPASAVPGKRLQEGAAPRGARDHHLRGRVRRHHLQPVQLPRHHEDERREGWRREWESYSRTWSCTSVTTWTGTGRTPTGRSLAVARYASVEVRIVRLPYAVTEDHGKDLTDWWLEHDADRARSSACSMRRSRSMRKWARIPRRSTRDAASVVDAFDARRVGRPLALTVTVKGRREPGYSVPRKVAYRCTRDAGKQCAVCPMYNEGADAGRLTSWPEPIRPCWSSLTRLVRRSPSFFVASKGSRSVRS
jgi:hypothetical protein